MPTRSERHGQTAAPGSSAIRIYGPGTPENSLTGKIFKVDDIQDTITTSLFPQLFAAAFLDEHQHREPQPAIGGRLIQNMLGYEWDVRLDNGFRPGRADRPVALDRQRQHVPLR